MFYLTHNLESGALLSRMTWFTPLQQSKENKLKVNISQLKGNWTVDRVNQSWNQKTGSQECECSKAQFVMHMPRVMEPK